MQYTVDGFSAFLFIATVLSLLYPITAIALPRLSPVFSYAVFVLHSISLGTLTYLRIVDDFSFENVYNNSHSLQPLLYKITGLWGNYEGSFLLLVWLISAYTALMEIFLSSYNGRTIATSVQHLILFCLSLFSALCANPLLRVFVLDNDGLGFNPLLQDVGLSIHPPILFAGYAGFSPVLSIAIAALIKNTEPGIWAKLLRCWTLAAWALLTLGVSLGGWWAYRVLGWGGFWSWDPVENVALLPWLIGTALIHMLPVVRKSAIYCNFTLFLAISSFLCSLYSTFLVRSGFLISVHTFAHDSARGVFLLVLVNFIVFACFTTFIMTAKKRSEVCNVRYISKMTALLANVCLLLIAFFVVLMGTVYPMLLELFTGVTISVGSPYYSSVFSILVAMLLVILIVLPGLNWDGSQPFKFSFKISAVCAIVLTPIALFFGLSGVIMLLSVFLACSIVEDFFYKLPHPWTTETLLSSLRPGRCAMLLAHTGVAVLTMGGIYSSAAQVEKLQYMRVGDEIIVRDYRVVLSDIYLEKQEYYESLVGHFTVTKLENNAPVGFLRPENRYYRVEATKNVVSSIYHSILADIYVVIGDPDMKKGIAVKIHYKPLVSFVWFGCALLVLGGCFGIYNASLKLRQSKEKA